MVVKNFDTIVSGFTKTISELEALATDRHAKVEKFGAKVREFENKASDAGAEAMKAEKLKAKLESLLS